MRRGTKLPTVLTADLETSERRTSDFRRISTAGGGACSPRLPSPRGDFAERKQSRFDGPARASPAGPPPNLLAVADLVRRPLYSVEFKEGIDTSSDKPEGGAGATRPCCGGFASVVFEASSNLPQRSLLRQKTLQRMSSRLSGERTTNICAASRQSVQNSDSLKKIVRKGK
eukprot:5709984-Prymnesium_polylepis.1